MILTVVVDRVAEGEDAENEPKEWGTARVLAVHPALLDAAHGGCWRRSLPKRYNGCRETVEASNLGELSTK
jgi:hypothetical protein